MSSTWLKLTKNQANAKQHPEAELLLFENYLSSLSMASSKTNMRYSKICAKSRCVCFNEIVWLIIQKVKVKTKNRSHRYHINRTKSRHRYEYTEYKMCVSVMMVMFNKQQLNNTWSWIHEKVKQHLGWAEKKCCL